MVTIQKVRIVLGIVKKQAPAVLAGAKVIYNAFAADTATFPSPNPPLPTVLAQIQALDAAEQATKTKTVGTAQTRDTKLAVLYTSLESWRMYVQVLCDANPEQALAIAKAAAMSASQPPTHPKPVLQAKLAAQPGAVILVANASVLVTETVGKKVARSKTS